MSGEKEHKYAYKFGNSDRGILLAVLVGSLFLTAMVAEAAIGAALAPQLAGDTPHGENGNSVPTAAAGVAVVVGIVLVSECFTIVLIFIVLTIVSYIIYRLLSWVEQKCRARCGCAWRRPWCCLGALICWFVTITKWVAFVVTIVLAIAVVVSFVVCIITAIAVLLA